jgi:acetylornithine/succinyldiaminopimelate/putrescine aminotransferase
VIVGARGAHLLDDQGRELVDLCAGYGSVWLGHDHPGVRRALAAQLEAYAAPGYLPFEALGHAHAALQPFLPAGHFIGGIYSTGMEAVETALRAARAQTGRRDVAGFAGSTHGRSFLTSAIGGGETVPFVHHLPAFSAGAERIGAALAGLAGRVKLAAIVVEPVLMSGGGHELGREACERVFAAAAAQGAAVIFDETLTGLHRCGARSYAEAMGVAPDIVVLGKGLANGFPAAAVTLKAGFAWSREKVHPGSTYWNHPLACAAIAATLSELGRLDAAARVEGIARVIRAGLGHLRLRGRGAMWCLESPRDARQREFAEALLRAGVVASWYERTIRLLPPLTIEPAALERACKTIAAVHADTFG